MTKVKSFDAIFSLGSSCQVASQLRRNGLRTAAGPFDWFNFASTPGFCQVLESRFERFMLLIRTVKHTEDAFRIFETIENSYMNPHLRYLFVLHSGDPDTAEIDSGHPQIRIVRMPAGATWEGDAEAWKKVLAPYCIRRCPGNHPF